MSATASYGWKVMDNAWVSVQRKTFTNWVNMHLTTRNLTITNLFQLDGYRLANLLEIVSGEKINGVQKKETTNRIQLISNLSPSINFINKILPRTHIDANNFITENETNEKLIMGLIFELILKYSVEEISVEEKSAKQGLLLWAQRATAGYKGVDIKNFSSSFQNGLAFIAILHAFAPEAVPNYEHYYQECVEEGPGTTLTHDEINKRAGDRLEFAFEGFHQKANIHKLLDYEFVISPDDKSCITYLTLLFKAFGSSKTKDIAGRRVKKMLARARKHKELEDSYEKKAVELRTAITEQIAEYSEHETTIGSLMGCQDKIEALLAEIYSYEQDGLSKIENDLADTTALFTTVNMTLKADGKATAYKPEDISLLPEALTEAVTSLKVLVTRVRENLVEMLRLSNICDGQTTRFDRVYQTVQRLIEDCEAVLKTELIADNQLTITSGPVIEAANTELKIAADAREEAIAALAEYEPVFTELEAAKYGKTEELRQKASVQKEEAEKLAESVEERKGLIAAKAEYVAELIRLEKERGDRCVRLGAEARSFASKAVAIGNKVPIFTANDTIESLKESKEKISALATEIEEMNNEEAKKMTEEIVECLNSKDYPMELYAPNATADIVETTLAGIRTNIANSLKEVESIIIKKEETVAKAAEIKTLVKELDEELNKISETSDEIQKNLINVSDSDAAKLDELNKLAEEDLVKLNELEGKIKEQVHAAIAETADYDLIAEARAVAARSKTLRGVLNDSIKIIDQKKMAAKGTTVSETQLSEWRTLFDQFDMSGLHQGLARHELAALFTSLSEDVSEETIESLYADCKKVMRKSTKKEDNGADVEVEVIEFNKFVEFMTRRNVDFESKQEIADAFSCLGGADRITIDQLKAVGVDDAEIAFIEQNFEMIDGAYPTDKIMGKIFD